MTLKPIAQITLFYGDNLFILRELNTSKSVDLIYLDPYLSPIVNTRL